MPNPNQYGFRLFALLLEKIEVSRLDVKVLCQDETQSCQLYFQQGQLIHAQSVLHSSEDVIFYLLNWRKATFLVEPGTLPTALEHNLNSNQRTIFRETVKLFQSKGIFDLTLPAAPPAAIVPKTVVPVAPPATQSGVDAVYHSISKPVEWNIKIETKMSTATPPKRRVASLTNLQPAEMSVPDELKSPVSIGFAATPMELGRAEEARPGESLFSYCLPPGRQAEPIVRLDNFRLSDIVRRLMLKWPNSYILISSKDEQGVHFGMLLLEQGQLTTVRYAKDAANLKAQAAYDQLEAVAANSSSEISIYDAELKLLCCYRTLLSGNYLVGDARAHTLDVQSLVGEQVRQKATIALRLYNEQMLVFYLVHKGEVLGSFQVRNNTMERGGEITPLLHDSSIRLDLLEAAAPETIELESQQMLSTEQVSTLTETASTVLQLLATLAGQRKVLEACHKVIEGAVNLFPCLQRLSVGLQSDRLEISWTLDQTQAFVTKTEAQTAFNFILTALMAQHNDLLGRATLRELIRRALQNNQIDLNKAQLNLNCLA